jgi:hypothetical protein
MRKNRFVSVGASLAAVSAVAIGFASTSHADNLLLNPSFEAPTEPNQNDNTDIVAWTLDLNARREAFGAHTGTWGVWAQTFMPAGGDVKQTVGVIAGNTYNLSSWLFFEGSYPNTTAEIQLSEIFQDSNNNTISETDKFIEPTDNPPTNTWVQEFLPSAVAPAGASQVVVQLGWNGGGTVSGAQSVFFDDVDLEGVGTVIKTSAWAHDGSGDFNNQGNWGNGTVPTGVDAEADFFGVITANHTVFTDIPITLGTVNFNNANKYVFAGAGSLTLAVSTGSAQVIVQQGTQEINLPLTISSNTIFNVASGATLMISDPITVGAGNKITQTGAGTVVYQSIITVQASAAISFGNTTYAHQLVIQSSGSSAINGSSSLLTVDSLSNSGLLDVNNGALDIDYGAGTSPINTIYAQLAQGYNAGKWNGTAGIKSTAAASDASKRTALGFATAGDVGLTTLDGQPLDANSVVVKYTYYGDASLDGKVDLGNDFVLFLEGYLGHKNGWYFGDFNYDGQVNNTDFGIFVDGFKTQGGSLGDLDNVIESSPLLSISQKASLLSAVPEPATAGVLGLAMSMIFARRRRA